ncbi:MAG: ABC transporter permease [Thermomicrobiales bacterium]|nr:ABC transporter permease [Thermomicrobiales bacterium]
MINLLKSELFRVRKRPQAWIMILIVVLFQVALYAGLIIASFVREDPSGPNRNIQLDRLWETGLIPTQILSGIMLIVFASSLMGNEFSWNTIRPLIARAPNRVSLLTAKLLTIVLYAFALAIAGVLSAVLGSVVGSALVGIDSGLTGERVVDILATIGRIGLGGLPYAALAFMLAVLTRSNVAGIAIAIALSFLEDVIFALLGLLTDIFDDVREYGLAYNVNTVVLYAGNSDYTSSDLWRSIAICLVYTVIFTVIAFRVFTKRDVTTG